MNLFKNFLGRGSQQESPLTDSWIVSRLERIERKIEDMSDQIAQLQADQAAQAVLIAGLSTDVGSVITIMQTDAAQLTALAAQGAPPSQDTLAKLAASFETNTAALQKIKDSVDAAIAPPTPHPVVTPPVTPPNSANTPAGH